MTFHGEKPSFSTHSPTLLLHYNLTMFLRLPKNVSESWEIESDSFQKEMGLEDDGPNVKKEERIVVYQHINAPTDIYSKQHGRKTLDLGDALRRLHRTRIPNHPDEFGFARKERKKNQIFWKMMERHRTKFEFETFFCFSDYQAVAISREVTSHPSSLSVGMAAAMVEKNYVSLVPRVMQKKKTTKKQQPNGWMLGS